MFQSGGKASISVRFLTEQSVPISSNTFWEILFLEKGSPKITEGGPFDPHWLISRINPVCRTLEGICNNVIWQAFCRAKITMSTHVTHVVTARTQKN